MSHERTIIIYTVGMMVLLLVSALIIAWVA